MGKAKRLRTVQEILDEMDRDELLTLIDEIENGPRPPEPMAIRSVMRVLAVMAGLDPDDVTKDKPKPN